MEDNVNTEATGADSSTSCDDSSTNSSHSSRSGGLNEGRVTSPASDGGETATGRPSSTGVAEEDYDDDDGRDFGEESRPLCVPRAPADRAGMLSECSSNGTTAMLPEQLMQCAAPSPGSSSHGGGPRSSSNRRASLVNTRYDGALRTGDMASHRNGTATTSGAAAQRRNDAVKNAASSTRETSSIMETSGVSTKSSSSSSHVGGTEDRSAFPGGQDAAVGRTDSEEVSEVSAEEDGQFLDAEDGGTAGVVVTAAPAAGEHLGNRSEEAVECRNDVCEGAQAPQQLQRLPQPLRQQQQEERQQHFGQQQQQSTSQEQSQQGSPQHEHQRRELPPQQQQPFLEEQQLQAAEHQQQQPAQQEQLAQQRQGAELEQRQEPQEACEPRGHEQRNQQRGGELAGGGDCGARRVLEEGEETRATAAAEGRVGLGVNSDSAGGMLLRAEVRETEMPSTDVREELQQQATREDEQEEEEDAEAEGGAVDKSDENSSSEEEDEGEAGSSSNKKSFGCQHYRRRCKVVAPCCGEAFWCRHCHNDVKCEQEKDFRRAHEIDRTAVTEVICAVCETRQGVSNQCISCKVEFGKYYCEKCKFWDDKGIKKKVYHCDLCGLCRTGGAESFFHCTTCGSCYSTDIRGSHKCVEKAMHQPCPICCENMFTSIRQVHVLKCGHTLHADCLERLKSECSGMPRLRCPLCFRSLGEYSVFWRRLDEEVARTPLPQELRRKVSCTCNDCAARTEVDYHVVGLKCGACGSYNTREVGP